MKKNLIIIALIAIFLMGTVALNAVWYDVCVIVQGNPGSIKYEIPIGSSPQFYDQDSIGVMDPNNVNYFYLVIDGSAIKDDTIPNED